MTDERRQHYRRILEGLQGPSRCAPSPGINARLVGLEQVFRAPPMTPSLVDAIRQISPHLQLQPDERHRDIWQHDQNAACWAEYEHLRELLRSLQPRRILEIGPGLGRSLVFFSRQLAWQDCELHAFEGDGIATRYTVNGPRSDDSFCGNIAELRNVLVFNGVGNVTIHDAAANRLIDLPGPFDLVYGFYTIGFHWSLQHFLPELRALLGTQGSAVFTVPVNVRPLADLADLPCRLIAKDHAAASSGDQLLLIGPIAAAP